MEKRRGFPAFGRAMRKAIHEFYEALQLKPGATGEEVRRSYRKLVAAWHPDRFKPGSLMQKTAEDITKEANEAYDQLYKKQLYKKFLHAAGEGGAPRPRRSRPPRAERPQKQEKAPEPAPPPPPKARSAQGRLPLGRVLIRLIRPVCAAACLLAIGYAIREGSSSRTVPSSPPAVAPPPAEPSRIRAAPAVHTPPAVRGQQGRGVTQAESAEPMGGGPSSQQAILAAHPKLPPTSAGTLSIGHLGGSPTAWEDFTLAASPPDESAAAGSRFVLKPLDLSAQEADWQKLIEEAQSLLRTFDVGDTQQDVISIEGRPDDQSPTLLRYGSSLVHFRDGYVDGWIDGVPRLRLHRLPIFLNLQLSEPVAFRR